MDRFEFPVDFETRVDRFVAEGWPQLAGAAWRYNMASGRCAIAIAWPHVHAFTEGLRVELELRAITRSDDADLQRAIDSYDPQTSAVCAFVSADHFAALAGGQARMSDPVYWRVVTMEPPPPRAHTFRGD